MHLSLSCLWKEALFDFHCYWQGVIIFHDVFDNEHEVGGAQIKVEGVYIWPFRQLRMVANRYIYICWHTSLCFSLWLSGFPLLPWVDFH